MIGGFPPALAVSVAAHLIWVATLAPDPPEVARRVLRDPVPAVIVASLDGPITVAVQPAPPPEQRSGVALVATMRRGGAGASARVAAAARPSPPRPPLAPPRATLPPTPAPPPRRRPTRPRPRPAPARPEAPVAALGEDDEPAPASQIGSSQTAAPAASAEPGSGSGSRDDAAGPPREGDVADGAVAGPGEGGDAASGDGAGRGSALTAYLAELSRRARAAARYPRAARRLGLAGEVLVALTVDAHGRVVAASIARSSGAEALDAAALDAVRGLELPAPEATLVASLERVRVPVRFHPRDG